MWRRWVEMVGEVKGQRQAVAALAQSQEPPARQVGLRVGEVARLKDLFPQYVVEMPLEQMSDNDALLRLLQQLRRLRVVNRWLEPSPSLWTFWCRPFS